MKPLYNKNVLLKENSLDLKIFNLQKIQAIWQYQNCALFVHGRRRSLNSLLLASDLLLG